MTTNNLTDKSFQDCINLINSLDSITETYSEAKPCRFNEKGEVTSLKFGVDEKKVSHFLNEILIDGLIKIIADSNNQELVSKFYKTLQNVYGKLESQRFGFSDNVKNLLEQIRSSFYTALPNGNNTKNEIEHNIQIIENRNKNNKENNKYTVERKTRKDAISENLFKIALLVLAGILYLLWGGKVLIAYLSILCLGLTIGIFQQLRNKPKKIKRKVADSKIPKKTSIIPAVTKTEKLTKRQEIIQISIQFGDVIYESFITSFNQDANNFGLVTKFECEMYAFFLCDMFSFGHHKSESLRAKLIEEYFQEDVLKRYANIVQGKEADEAIQYRLQAYFEQYKSFRNELSTSNKTKNNLEKYLLFLLENTKGIKIIHKTYPISIGNAFEKTISTVTFLDKYKNNLEDVINKINLIFKN